MQTELVPIVTPVLAGLDRELGGSYAAVLYGSGARGEFRPGVSDLNLLLVCESLEPGALRRLGASFAVLRRERQPPPLLLERAEWMRAVDVFPIEITDMQLAHETLRGNDLVSGLRIDPAELRRALEQELRAKLLRLRQAFAAYAGEPPALGEVASQSISSVCALFRVALSLFGGPPPAGTPAALRAAATRFGTDPAPLLELWEQRRTGQPCPVERFQGYLAAVGAAVRVIDQFTGGGN